MYDLTALPLFTTGNDVADMIVDGKLIMTDGSVLTMDESEVLGRAREVEPKITERLGRYVAQ